MSGWRRRGIAVVAGLSLGCGGSTSPRTTVDGGWQGIAGADTVTITLASTGQSVSGSGTIAVAGSTPYPVTISGTFVVPTLAVTLTSTQHAPLTLAATLGNGTLAGALDGGAYADVVIVLRRK